MLTSVLNILFNHIKLETFTLKIIRL